MDMSLTDEQHLLRTVAHDFVSTRWPVSRIMAAADRPPAVTGADLDELAALGWWDPAVGSVERALVAEECGWGLIPVPWHGPLTLGRLTPDAGTSCVLAPAGGTGLRARREGAQWLLDGTIAGVPYAAQTPSVVAPATSDHGAALFRFDPAAAEALTVVPGPDPLRPGYRLLCAATPAQRLDMAPAAAERLGAVLAAAEAVGVARRAYEWAAAHAGSRVQFGRPIGAYQAVAFAIADSYTRIELARSLVWRAAWLADAGDPEADLAAAQASAAARTAAVEVCEQSVQTFGGQGMTWENPLHLWYRRAWWLQSWGRTPHDDLDRIAATVLAA